MKYLLTKLFELFLVVVFTTCTVLWLFVLAASFEFLWTYIEHLPLGQ